MTQARAGDILRRIIPWAIEANVQVPKYRKNYKGVRGRIGIVGGARDYAGAPYFASMSTMKLGADLAYVICSQGASQVIKNYSPDLIVTPLLDCPNDSEFSSEIDCLLSRLHTLVIGPGLGRDKLLQDRAKLLIEEAKTRSLSLVLDADSLILVNENPSIIKSYEKVLLTPNRIELQRMLNALFAPKLFDLRNTETQQIIELVKQCSAKLNVSILAKGLVDVCCHPSGFVLKTDESSGSNRRCGGQGDILAGLAGVYLHWIDQANRETQQDNIEHPVVWASYLAAITTRLANELAFKEFHQGMLASQMVDKIHIALDQLLVDLPSEQSAIPKAQRLSSVKYSGSLSADEISRYARQMIMDEFGPQRQLKLKRASAIIIGAGGLGCPAAVYLGAGGIGRLGIVDDDCVEASNLHRQILHNLEKVGMLKTESIKQAVQAINPNVKIDTYSVRMTRHNAVELIEPYDIVIDATDNLLARYLISDACVVAKKPLVSGAALKIDGQLTVYNYDKDTPCFRCLFPEPPPQSAVGSCSDNGVLGVIPGIIGVQQALEALKIGAGLRPAYAGKMLLFDGQLGLFRHITLGKRKPDCEACGGDDGKRLGRNLIDYDKFCGASLSCKGQASAQNARDTILYESERISVEQYRDILESRMPHVLVDVRPLVHSEISRFEHALQLPVQEMLDKPEETRQLLLDKLKCNGNTNRIYVVCRRGIASQRGVRIIEHLFEKGSVNDLEVKDIKGGMTAWSKQIDPNYSCL